MDIAIWGTGNVGKYVFQQIKDNTNYAVKYFVDRNAQLWGSKLNGVEIISPDQLQNLFSDELDFVLVAFTKGISIYKQLTDMQINNFGIIRDRIYEAQIALMEDLQRDRNIVWNNTIEKSKPLIESVETNVVDSCNLNCRGCSHFSNLFRYGEKVPFDSFCQDLKQIAEHAWIYQLNLLGGEALLAENIIEYMNYAREILPDSEIYLISNGLLIPRQKQDFFDCCKKNNILISVSGYKPTLQLEDKIREILEHNEIVYSFRYSKEEFGKNIDLTGTANPYEAVRSCRESSCHFFRYGKLFKCPFEALGNKLFEYYDLDIRFDGGYDIYDEKLNWNIVADNLIHKPVHACRYCGKEEKIEWYVANNPVLDDWIVRNDK